MKEPKFLWVTHAEGDSIYNKSYLEGVCSIQFRGEDLDESEDLKRYLEGAVQGKETQLMALVVGIGHEGNVTSMANFLSSVKGLQIYTNPQYCPKTDILIDIEEILENSGDSSSQDMFQQYLEVNGIPVRGIHYMMAVQEYYEENSPEENQEALINAADVFKNHEFKTLQRKGMSEEKVKTIIQQFLFLRAMIFYNGENYYIGYLLDTPVSEEDEDYIPSLDDLFSWMEEYEKRGVNFNTIVSYRKAFNKIDKNQVRIIAEKLSRLYEDNDIKTVILAEYITQRLAEHFARIIEP
jgi:hypothetical protein